MGHCERNTGGTRMEEPSGASISVKISNSEGIVDASSLFYGKTHNKRVAMENSIPKYLNFAPVSVDISRRRKVSATRDLCLRKIRTLKFATSSVLAHFLNSVFLCVGLCESDLCQHFWTKPMKISAVYWNLLPVPGVTQHLLGGTEAARSRRSPGKCACLGIQGK